ncbi:CHAT domain-containing protein [Ditylenchus destructor]|nr:CHAT domain-containing protein [Ditylenchus destructor]
MGSALADRMAARGAHGEGCDGHPGRRRHAADDGDDRPCSTAVPRHARRRDGPRGAAGARSGATGRSGRAIARSAEAARQYALALQAAAGSPPWLLQQKMRSLLPAYARTLMDSGQLDAAEQALMLLSTVPPAPSSSNGQAVGFAEAMRALNAAFDLARQNARSLNQRMLFDLAGADAAAIERALRRCRRRRHGGAAAGQSLDAGGAAALRLGDRRAGLGLPADGGDRRLDGGRRAALGPAAGPRGRRRRLVAPQGLASRYLAERRRLLRDTGGSAVAKARREIDALEAALPMLETSGAAGMMRVVEWGEPLHRGARAGAVDLGPGGAGCRHRRTRGCAAARAVGARAGRGADRLRDRGRVPRRPPGAGAGAHLAIHRDGARRQSGGPGSAPGAGAGAAGMARSARHARSRGARDRARPATAERAAGGGQLGATLVDRCRRSADAAALRGAARRERHAAAGTARDQRGESRDRLEADRRLREWAAAGAAKGAEGPAGGWLSRLTGGSTGDSGAGSELAILADPRYGEQTLGVAAKPGSLAARDRGMRDAVPAPLPETRAEAADVAEAGRRMGLQPRLLLGAEATPERLAQVRRPAILHVAAHGALLSTEPLGDLASQERVRLLMPGQLAALVLSADAQGPLFSASQLEAMDLRGTRLVVLSACDTGNGVLDPHEGLASLRHAAELAGARATLTSLWPVPNAADRAPDASVLWRLGRGPAAGRGAHARQASAAQGGCSGIGMGRLRPVREQLVKRLTAMAISVAGLLTATVCHAEGAEIDDWALLLRARPAVGVAGHGGAAAGRDLRVAGMGNRVAARPDPSLASGRGHDASPP